MPALESVNRQFQEIRSNCDRKRRDLLRQAQVRERLYKILSFTSGTLGLFSSLAATTIFTELTSSTLVKVLTAIVMFISGILGLFVASFIDPKENALFFEGAGEFLVLREKISAELYKETPTEDQAIALLKEYSEKYALISAKYDRYVGKGGSSAPPPGLPSMMKQIDNLLKRENY